MAETAKEEVRFGGETVPKDSAEEEEVLRALEYFKKEKEAEEKEEAKSRRRRRGRDEEKVRVARVGEEREGEEVSGGGRAGSVGG